MRIFSFIGSIILLIVSAIISYFIYSLTWNLPSSGWEGLISMVVIIPLALVLGLVLLSALFGGLVNSIRAIGSENMAIKIISIILLIAYVVLTVLDAALIISIINS